MPHDAGRMREELAAELAEWREAGYWSPHRARRFHRRVRLLARLTGLSRDEVYADLQADADAMAAERD